MEKATDFERFTGLVLDEFKRVNQRFDGADVRFDALDEHFHELDRHFDRMESDAANLRSAISGIHKQLDELGEAARNFSGFTKEIDLLLSRVTAIEKHLGLQHNIDA